VVRDDSFLKVGGWEGLFPCRLVVEFNLRE
jgi:hypothetical protein